MSTIAGVDGLEITGPIGDRYDEVLTPRALELVALLHRELNGRRLERLAARERVQALADGGTLDFLPETAHIREDDSWRVADPAPGLVDRRVEMTGPTDRKMTINALTREANDGFDGSWVAHPGMVQTAMAVFDQVLGDKPSQLDRLREDVQVTAAQLLDVRSTPGEATEAGLRADISVGIQYVESWLCGSGAVGINDLMEDAATAEISRSQVWQWLHNGVRLSNGETVTRELVERITDEEIKAITESRGDALAPGRWDDARALFLEMAVADDYSDFLTLPAYERMP
jgi:malate synthase